MTGPVTLANSDPILVLGYGNPGRQDDGLGPALIAMLESDPPPGLVLDSDYQLTVENAWDLAQYMAVILVDASISGAEPYSFEPLGTDATLSFSTHSVSPGAVLQLSKELFNASPNVYMLGICGYEFDQIKEGLTAQAAANCEAAEQFIRQRCAARDFSVLID